MASSAMLIGFIETGNLIQRAPQQLRRMESVFLLVLDDLLAAVVTVGADVMPAMGLARARLDRQRGAAEGVMRATHVAAGWGFAAFLHGHDDSPENQLRCFRFFNTANGLDCFCPAVFCRCSTFARGPHAALSSCLGTIGNTSNNSSSTTSAGARLCPAIIVSSSSGRPSAAASSRTTSSSNAAFNVNLNGSRKRRH